MANIQSLYDQLRTHIDLLNENIEPSKCLIVHCVVLARSLYKYMLEVPSQAAVR